MSSIGPALHFLGKENIIWIDIPNHSKLTYEQEHCGENRDINKEWRKGLEGGIQYLITAQKLCCNRSMKYKRSQCFLNSVQSQVTYRVYHTGNAYVTLGY